MPSLLSVLVYAVRTDEAVLIFKDECRKFKCDAAVLALIFEILPLIPFVAHLYIQIVSQDGERPTLAFKNLNRPKNWVPYP